MPIRTEPDAAERRQVEKALERLRSYKPKSPRLAERAKRGSLQTNLNALSTESGVARHRIEKLYPDLAAQATAERGERGSVTPLRQRLDAVRQEKLIAARRLDLSQSYSFRLMERISQFRTEVRLLKDRVAELEAGVDGGGADEHFLGTDDVIGIPAMPARKKGRGRASGAAP